MTILLTGATGFIGKHVLKALSEHNVVPLSRSKKNGFYQADILDKTSMIKCVEDVRPRILIHLAWDVTHGLFWHSPLNTDYKNATITLFDTCAKNGTEHIIATGTCAEYESSPFSITEDNPVDLNLLTPYGRSKRQCCDHLISKGYDFTWFRIFGITGCGENPERFFPKAKQSLLDDEPFFIKEPNVFQDYIDVEIFAQIMLQSVKKGPCGIVNVGCGISQSMQSWYNQIKGDKSDVNLLPSPLSKIPDCRKIQSLLKI